jgi:hypothetical protein
MTARTLAVAAVLMTLAGQAAGQNALGDGTNLHASPRIGGDGRNLPVRDLQAEIRFRNAIVTGNAPNGLSFRGDLPYTAPGDFRGQSASNDLYAFRRDSLYSGLAGMGIRGTEALQQQFALTTGNTLPDLLSGSLTVNRFGAADPDFSRKVTNQRPALTGLGADPAFLEKVDTGSPQLQTDFSGLALGTLRSTSAYTSTRGIQPTLLDIRTTPNQDLIGVSASTLRGIQSFPLGKATADNSAAGKLNALNAGSGTQPSGRIDNSAPGSTLLNAQTPGATTTGYQTIVDRLNEYGAPAAPVDPPAQGTPGAPDPARDPRPLWQQQLDDLRATLAAAEAAPPAASTSAHTPTATAPLAPIKNFTFDTSTLDLVRNAPGTITTLLPDPRPGFDPYTEHMRIAQTELGKNHYFDAEEEFTRALAGKPADPMALVGRIHAQLGAGTNLSAWMNLRSLFLAHPELLGARYAAALLPEPARLEEITVQLRTIMDKGGPLHREAAMLLAYVGYQSNDSAALEDGLRAMGQAKEGRADALSDLMAAVWSGHQPAPQPLDQPLDQPQK